MSMTNTSRSRARVLIADDNDMIRDTLSTVLIRKGYDVLECEDGAQTKALLSAEPIDVLILDLQMPNVSGYKVLDWLDTQALELSVFVCTGTLVDLNAMARRDVAVFHKPFRMAELLEAIKTSLTRGIT